MKDKTKITVDADGVIETHIAGGVAGYATLCGLDGDDDGKDVMQKTISTPIGAKVTCAHCIGLWLECKRWRVSDFDMQRA